MSSLSTLVLNPVSPSSSLGNLVCMSMANCHDVFPCGNITHSLASSCLSPDLTRVTSVKGCLTARSTASPSRRESVILISPTILRGHLLQPIEVLAFKVTSAAALLGILEGTPTQSPAHLSILARNRFRRAYLTVWVQYDPGSHHLFANYPQNDFVRWMFLVLLCIWYTVASCRCMKLVRNTWWV